ncbi:hypothetical protein TNCV_3027851 [Trichonephila clavipes]|nr:hypothetical protein TNCV_3027851 [Trichonephila clavipes]
MSDRVVFSFMHFDTAATDDGTHKVLNNDQTTTRTSELTSEFWQWGPRASTQLAHKLCYPTYHIKSLPDKRPPRVAATRLDDVRLTLSCSYTPIFRAAPIPSDVFVLPSGPSLDQKPFTSDSACRIA